MPPIRLAALALLALAAVAVRAQTAPAPFPLATGDYTFAAWPATAPAGTYPAAMRVHQAASGQDPAPTDAFAADYVGPYSATAGTRVVGLGENGIAFLNTGTAGRLGALTLALDATGAQNVRVSWTGGTAATGSRPYVLRLQYRVGASGTYTDAGAEYVAGATGHAEPFSTVLPAEVNGAPVVHVRWVYAQVGTGAGNRPQLRVDDVTVSTSDAAASGTGTAAFAPALLRGGAPQALALVVTARSDEPADRLTDLTFTLPAVWGAVAPSQVTLVPAGGTVSVAGSTVSVAGADASQSAPLRIEMAALAVPDASAFVEVGVRTGAGSAQTVAIATQPVLRVWSTPEPMATVRANTAAGVSTRLGEAVTVQGVVTVSDAFRTGGGERGPSFLEDASGGLAVFSPEGVAAAVEPGEEVVLLGVVDQFFGLNQLSNATEVVERVGFPGAPAPLVVTLQQLAADGAGGAEAYEGRLVRVEGVTVNTTVWTAEGAGTNYLLTDATGALDVRINPGTDLAGQPAPTGPFALTGVVSQFRPAAPFVGGYQLMPRGRSDIEPLLNAPAIAPQAPFEHAVAPTSVTLRWTTDRPAHSEVRYTTAGGASGGVVSETRTTAHEITLTDLAPATVYTVELRAAADADTASVAGYPVSTASPPGSTGAVEVLFNQSVDATVATGPTATTADLAAHLVGRIAQAQASLDVALYSLSGTAGAQIAQALVAAHQRGVRVRVIMDDETSTTAPPNTLRAASIPVITDAFGQNDGAAGLHHNKFVVVDHLGTDPARVWAMTGSWNPTDPGTAQHFQNVVWVQDAALAGAFTAEFEQMWGGSGSQPDAAHARFHHRKTLVAPSVFQIGGVPVRLLFSPQGFGPYGSVESEILKTIATADHELALNLNLITRLPIVDAVRARHDAGVTVRGVVGEITTTGSVFASLAFADVRAFPSDALGLLHHKTALVDAQSPLSDPVVITGSHNWSRAANESNNENTLFLRSAPLANLFLQEFAARYAQAGGTGTFPTDAGADGGALAFGLSAPAPNPARHTARLALSLPAPADVAVRLYNVLGQEVRRPHSGPLPAGRHAVPLDLAGLAAGVYVVRAEALLGGRTETTTRRLTVVR
jgi:phosphatidylserine/phosphatidylglycerophosphate/cardiolipin synthase-like enzyme